MSTASCQAGYLALTAVHLALNFAASHPWDVVTKCLLAPTLLGISLSQPRPVSKLSSALFFCFLGDFFLVMTAEPGDLWFLGGMGSFAVAHLCFITILRPVASYAAVAAALLPTGAFAVALVMRTWAGLEADLRVPVCIYAVLLGATVVTSLASYNLEASLGAILFMISDALILMDVVNDRLTPSRPWFWIMLTYSSAIFLLQGGILRHRAKP